MKMHKVKSFFLKRQKFLGIAATAYVVLLLLSHWQLPTGHVWVVAAVFSIAMNFTYLVEAVSIKKYVVIESLISISLISASILGLIYSPLFLIAAIFGHGCWDLAKHFGKGVPFYFWYRCSCFLVDTAYSAALLMFWLNMR